MTEITAGVTKTFDDVKALVRDQLADEKARAANCGGARGGRKRAHSRPIAQGSRRKLGLTFKAIEAVSRGGNGPDGKPIDGIPDVAKVLGAVFQSGQGIEADAVDLADGGLAWFDVLGVTPEKERAFDDVKADVKARWIEIEKGQGLDRGDCQTGRARAEG